MASVNGGCADPPTVAIRSVHPPDHPNAARVDGRADRSLEGKGILPRVIRLFNVSERR
jgi:hypothetical protein